MNKLTVAAAALAAGLTSFASSTLAETDFAAIKAQTQAFAEAATSEKTEKAAEPEEKSGKPEKTGNSAEAEKQPAEPEKQAAKAEKPAKAKKGLPGVDVMTTASISATEGGKAKAAAISNAQFANIVSKYAAQNGVPEALAHAVIRVESNYRPNVTGSAGEVGLMQIKPATARMMGYSGSTKGLYDPETNIRFGLKYLAKAQNVGDGSTCGTILKYNAGHGAKRMNPVSANYCAKVKQILAGA